MFISTVWRRVRLLPFLLCLAFLVPSVAAQSPAQDTSTIDLILRSGRSLRVALDRRVTIHRVGQTVTGTLIERVYVYDRIVLPIGCRLTGHIDRIEQPSKKRRALAMIEGDFSPHPRAILRFDSIEDPSGHTLSIATAVKGGVLRARPQTAKGGKNDADGEEKTSRVEQAREAASERAHAALAVLKDPGKKERLEEFAISKLPYHPEFLARGMVYDVELIEPVSFGTVTPTPPAPRGSLPAPDSVLTAKLATTINSARTTRGAPITAVLTQPVFSAQHQLILPEGTLITGEVTRAKQARHWHRNGQLRVLFESVQSPTLASQPMRAALYSVDAAAGSGVRVDEEGGTTIANSKTRFVAPALALLAFRGSAHQDHELDIDPGEAPHMVAHGNAGARGLGGLLGFSGIGAVIAQFSRPVAIGLSFVGVGRTVYANVIGKGHEVTFSADTPIQVRLAPGAPAQPGTPAKKKRE